MASMLQVPNSDVGSLPPSQTATLVGPMAAEITNTSQHEWNESAPQMSEAQPAPPIATALPKVPITFLLGSGKRKTLEFEQSDSFGTVKEHITHEWPTEWEGELKPQAASSIRLFHLGRLIGDEESLSANLRFAPRPAAPTIVHLSVRPFAPRQPSNAGSLKAKTSLLRTGNAFSFSGRGNASAANSPTAAVPSSAGAAAASSQAAESQEHRDSGCCCVIC